MRFITATVLIMLLSFCACLFFPWWSIAIVAFIVTAMIRQLPLSAFFSGFLALLLLWGGLSLYISINNEHILAERVSMLILKADQPYGLIALTAFIGALVAGFASLSASFLRARQLRRN